MNKLVPALIFVVALCGIMYSAWAFNVHSQYDVSPLKAFNGNNFAERLVLEKARAYEGGGLQYIERVQVRATTGQVVAFSPTRVTAIPFCFGLHSCWVFLWKTVYPFPAVYKLSSSPYSWISHPNPPMKYSRIPPAGQGFEDKTNLLLGAFGIVLLAMEKTGFLVCCILFTIILTLQITNYRDMPEFRREWIRRIFFLLFGLTPLPLPVEPYMITATLIFLMAGFGSVYVGVPLVVSVAVILATFFLCAMRLARLKSLPSGPA